MWNSEHPANKIGIATVWSPAHRVAFRFACAYLFFYSFPFPLGRLPWTGWLTNACHKLWLALVPWTGKHVLRLTRDIAMQTNGSGDKTSNYVEVFCFAVVALATTLAWSLLDRRATEYRKLHHWLRVYLRYVLAATMLSYGTSKVFRLQFGPLPLGRLLQTYGDSSPMGLLWTFMDFSAPYTIFSGAAEALGGLLLFLRRTTTLGALVVASVMTNIVMLNFCYDVPVKLYSSHLLLMAVFLLVGDGRRLARVLVLNRPVNAATDSWRPPSRWMRNGAVTLKILFIGFVLFSTTSSQLERRKKYGRNGPTHPLHGVYDVEELNSGQPVPTTTTDTQRWRQVSVGGYGEKAYLSIKLVDNTWQGFHMVDDPTNKTLILTNRKLQSERFVLRYTRPNPAHLTLEGRLREQSIRVRLRKIDAATFLLTSRGFHWINEIPFNR